MYHSNIKLVIKNYKKLCYYHYIIQSVPQTHFGSDFQKGKIFPFGKESVFLFRKNQPLLEDRKFKLLMCMLLVFCASRNVSFNYNNHFLKFFTGFENLPSSSFLNSENRLLSIEQSMWLHLYFLFGKFHLDIHNKMADNNGTALPHETNFDIIKDCLCCWIDVFIRWFEDYQLLYQFFRLLLKVDICSVCKCNYLQTWLSILYSSAYTFALV